MTAPKTDTVARHVQKLPFLACAASDLVKQPMAVGDQISGRQHPMSVSRNRVYRLCVLLRLLSVNVTKDVNFRSRKNVNTSYAWRAYQSILPQMSNSPWRACEMVHSVGVCWPSSKDKNTLLQTLTQVHVYACKNLCCSLSNVHDVCHRITMSCMHKYSKH